MMKKTLGMAKKAMQSAKPMDTFARRALNSWGASRALGKPSGGMKGAMGGGLGLMRPVRKMGRSK